MRQNVIAVIGPGNADEATRSTAEEVGRLIAKRGALLVCGGLGGVMEAAAKGAKEEGGITIGILPQSSKGEENQHITVPVATGFGEGRNVIIIRTADGIVAVGGEYGTLSEVAFALKLGKPIVGINSWDIKGVIKAQNPEEAVSKVFELIG